MTDRAFPRALAAFQGKRGAVHAHQLRIAFWSVESAVRVATDTTVTGAFR